MNAGFDWKPTSKTIYTHSGKSEKKALSGHMVSLRKPAVPSGSP
jgi:hypothetical protein